ncbi:MAG: CHAT domain-containing protein [Bacteroidia bacterium]
MAEPYTPIIFLAYANDRTDPGRYLRNLVSEVRNIRRLLENKVIPPYRVIVRGNVTLQEIEEVFLRYAGSVEVFHFAGHADDVQLLLESDSGERESADLTNFSRFLSAQAGLRLIFLNGCATQNHAKALSLAGVPAIISTDAAIHDRAAQTFATRFYKGLADHKTLQQAFDDASDRTQIQFDRGEPFRSLYIPGENKNTFPWNITGSGLQWRLSVAPPDSRGTIVPYLCDRDKQVERFRDSVEMFLSENTFAHAFIVHGPRAERHRSLVKRFREVEIRLHAERLFGRDNGLVHTFEIKDWPYTGDLAMRKRNLRRSLGIACELSVTPGTDWVAGEMDIFKTRKTGIIVFQHTLFAEKWDRTTSRLISWYLQSFWQFPNYEIPPRIIVFISVIYPEERVTFWNRLFGLPGKKQEVRKELHRLGQQLRQKISILRELSPVSYTDVAEWVEEYYPEDLTALPDIIFTDKKERPLPMEIVEYQLIRESVRIQRDRIFRDLPE